MAFLQTHVLKHLEASTVPSPWPHHAAGWENDRSQLPLRAHSLTGPASRPGGLSVLRSLTHVVCIPEPQEVSRPQSSIVLIWLIEETFIWSPQVQAGLSQSPGQHCDRVQAFVSTRYP